MISCELLQKFIVSYFNNEMSMTFIGHKELERNDVYLLPNDHQVLKVYSKRKCWAAEVASLKFLQMKDLCTPTLVDYGVFEGDLCWLIMSKLEGMVLSEIVDQITSNQYKKVLYEMGCALSNFHNLCRANQFGVWDENMDKVKNWLTFAEFEIDKNRTSGNRLLAQNFDENNLFKAGYSKMVSLEDSLTSVSSFSLCHNDLSDRNVLIEQSGDDIKIVGFIDFELSYPSDAESDLTKMVLKNYFNRDIDCFISGYQKQSKLSDHFEDKHKYYLISLCLEICSWAHGKAHDFYQQAVAVLAQLV